MPQQQGNSMSEAKPSQRFHSLNAEQVDVLHQVLSDVVPIHGRGNFPTLELRPRDIIIAVRARLQLHGILVRDVRLNGSTASHVLVRDNGTSYKDLDVIFGVELPTQEEFQVIKEAVLGCLLDCLPLGVNKERISSATMKEAYVQKMVKVFNEHDRWSLISLSNNSGKNLELKFVSSLRRQFEFSVDSFQIILDRLLESYMAQDLQRKAKDIDLREHQGDNQAKQTGAFPKQDEMEKTSQTARTERVHEKESQTEFSLQNDTLDQTKDSQIQKKEKLGQELPVELKDIAEHSGNVTPGLQTTSNEVSEQAEEAEKTQSEILDKTECQKMAEHSVQSTSEALENPCTHLLEIADKTQDTLPAPPGLLLIDKKSSKASERLSYMVVLKHSSPKPPRRMCRKVHPSSVLQTESAPTASTDPSPCPSPEPEENLTSDKPILDSPNAETSTAYENAEPSVELTSSPNDSTESSSSEIVCEKELQNTEPNAITSMESATIQLDPTDLSEENCTEIHNPVENTSDDVLSDDVKLQEIQIDVGEAEDPPLVSCLAPPVLSFSAPCFTPSSPPSLSPPPCQTPPSLCINTMSPSTSFSSAPMSFSPTSSCLSSPPYLTPPMLSLSPPPTCLSPPLLCLTPPVDSADLVVAQVSADEDLPLILDSSEQYLKEPATQQAPLLDTVDEKEDYISALPQGSKPVSFPITIPNAASNVLPQSVDPEESAVAAPPVAVAPVVTQESKKVSQNITPKLCLDSIGSAPDVEVLAESMYGDFEAAMDHLRYRLIATRNPEEIRGGGLLKYSNLLVRDYRPASETQIKTLERYMCSRFFIDFPDVQEQQRKILSYLKNHFIGEERSKYQYLMTLRRVVDDSTVCLMGHERRQTLNMITVLALKVLGEQNIIPNTDHVTCFYQPAPYITEPSYCSYYIPQGGSALLYQPYPLHLHSQTGLV
uniref:polynucleotide adenylyltransferase n=1 Tax=Knipowitschia caucasica TaxID=637954 RepID=A0AAV2MLM0_KNICA